MAYRSVGTKFKMGTTEVGGLTSIGGIEKSSETLDTTTLATDGGYRTFIGGFKDGGEVALGGYYEGDEGQSALDEAFEDGEVRDFEIVFPASLGKKWAFQGVVTNVGTSVDLDGLIEFSATIKVSGKPNLVSATA